MKKLISTAIGVAVLGMTQPAMATLFQATLTGVNGTYVEDVTFDNIGVEYFNDGGAAIEVVRAGGNETINNADEANDLQYSVLRDIKVNNGGAGNPTNSFGDTEQADPLINMTVINSATGDPITFINGLADPLYIDFRLVLEDTLNYNPLGPATQSFALIEEFSFVDLFTAENPDPYGLALDATGGTSTLEVTLDTGTNSGDPTVRLVSTGIAGEIFQGINNLPFGKLDENEEIQFSFEFTTGDFFTKIETAKLANESSVDLNGSLLNGDSTLIGTIATEVPEPSSIGIFGLSLLGLGAIQRRRKQSS